MSETNTTHHRLTGTLSKVGGISGTLSKVGGISGSLSVPQQIPVEEYTGTYDVTPTWEEQRLLTEGKKMTDDVTVEEIPIFKTTNPSGGTTVIIGG